MVTDRWSLFQSSGYADYFGAMFAEPRQRYIDATVLTDDEIAKLTARIVILHGRDDEHCPSENTSVALAKRLLRPDLHLLAACGHNSPRERTADYLAVALRLFASARLTLTFL